MSISSIENGQKLHRPFFVVAHNASSDRPFSVIRLKELEKSKTAFGDKSFLMPRAAGWIKTGPRAKCSYRVIDDTGTEQTVEVVWSDDDKTIWSRYRASRSGVVPVYSRMYYHGYMFQALPFALVFASAVFAVGRLLRRRQSRIGEER